MCPGQKFLYSGFRTSDHARVHAGNVYNQYAPSPAPEKPRPRMLLPFGRDKNFVGREEILESLAERLKDDDYHNRVALTGLGGIGKSQIAIEFTYRWQKKYQDRWVFWVPANNKARFIDAYREIARVAKIDGGSHDIMDSVHTWLSDEENGRWLMIVDNADSRDVLFGRKHGESKTIQSRIPQVAHGCVLITSRNQTGIDLSGDFQNLIEVPALQEAEAIDLLQRRMTERPDKKELSKLAKHLDCIPLALAQAAAYISKTRLDVKRYMSNLTRNEKSEVIHLAREWDDIRRANVPNAVLATFWVTINQIRAASPYTTVQLFVMAMFDRQAIPVRPSPRKDEAVGLLLEWAMIRKDLREHTYTMHRLVQICIKAWIKFHLPSGKNRLEHFRSFAVDELAIVTETKIANPTNGLYANLVLHLVPHLCTLARAKVLRSRQHHQLRFLQLLSACAFEMCDFDSALEYANEVLIRATLLSHRVQNKFIRLDQAVNFKLGFICGIICVEKGYFRAAEMLLRDMKTATKRSGRSSRRLDREIAEKVQFFEWRLRLAKTKKLPVEDYFKALVSVSCTASEECKRYCHSGVTPGEREKLKAQGVAQAIVDAVEEKYGPDNLFFSSILRETSDYFEAIGEVSTAEKLHRDATNVFEQDGDIWSPHRLHCLKIYAAFLRRQGREEEAGMVEQNMKVLRDSAG